jgi:hypothetical protein
MLVYVGAATGKVFRIGYLDRASSASSADVREVFRQELSKLGWFEGKIDLPIKNLSGWLILRLNWCV